MIPDERTELLHDAEQLAYQTIRFTGLYKSLTNDEWDELANKWGAHLVQLLEARVDEEFTRLQSERETKESVDVVWQTGITSEDS